MRATIAAGVADIRREPDAASELVTQALMNMPAETAESAGAWTRIALVDYEGWIRSAQLADPISKGFCKVGETCATPLPLVAVVTATHTPLYTDSERSRETSQVYLSTQLPLLDTTHPRRVQVALPGDQTAWLLRATVDVRQQPEPYPRQPISVVTNYARQFLDVPYLWGGTSWEGIDCSGFVQLCYRMGGSLLPRDADQQDEFLNTRVERSAMRAGDLIFFGEREITHVALALNDHEYIHAEGQNYNKVVINSFRPEDPRYYPRLDQIVWSLKQVVV